MDELKMIKPKGGGGTSFKVIFEYIRENMRYKISVENLMRAFGMSRSSLYNFSVKHFGMGITEYVSKLRIDTARDLLLNTDMSVSEISYTVGIYDTNYFIKQFRVKYGMSPKRWKNSYGWKYSRSSR